jgi:hypothetical protein
MVDRQRMKRTSRPGKRRRAKANPTRVELRMLPIMAMTVISRVLRANMKKGTTLNTST